MIQCPLCFEEHTFEQSSYLPDGTREDVCIKCATEERNHGIELIHRLRSELSALKEESEKMKAFLKDIKMSEEDWEGGTE
jgi:hypothetical protein